AHRRRDRPVPRALSRSGRATLAPAMRAGCQAVIGGTTRRSFILVFALLAACLAPTPRAAGKTTAPESPMLGTWIDAADPQRMLRLEATRMSRVEGGQLVEISRVD